MDAVGHDDEAGLLSFEEFFNYHTRTRFAEGVADQHVFYGSQSLRLGLGNDYPFSRRQTVGFDDNGYTHFGNVIRSRCHFVESRISCRGYAMTGQEVLAKSFGAL